MAKVCKGVAAYEHFFLMHSKFNEEPALAPELKVVMQDRQLYTDVALFVQFIHPFISAIAALESDSSTCGDVLIEMLRIRMTLENLQKDRQGNRKIVESIQFAMDVLDERSGDFNTDVHFVATYLNPQYKVRTRG